MNHRTRVILALAAMVALVSRSGGDLSSGPAFATIGIRNWTGARIEHIYIVSGAVENWSEDLLQGTPLFAYESRLLRDVPCEEQDVQLVDVNGQACVFEDMSLCTHNPRDLRRRYVMPAAYATWRITADSITNCVGFGAPVRFVIASGVNVVAVGQTVRMAATAFPANAVATPTPFDVSRQAHWTSSDVAVAAVSSDGSLTGGTPGMADISVNYAGAVYSLPVLVVPAGANEATLQYVGTWSGEGVMTCRRLSGIGKDVCDFDGRGVPDVHRRPIELTLGVQDGILTGTLQLYQSPSTGSVQGTALDSGDLIIGGMLRQDEHGVISQLREWSLHLTRRGRLRGNVTVDAAFMNVYGAQLTRQTFEISARAR
jgi:hypothetical protein